MGWGGGGGGPCKLLNVKITVEQLLMRCTSGVTKQSNEVTSNEKPSNEKKIQREKI